VASKTVSPSGGSGWTNSGRVTASDNSKATNSSSALSVGSTLTVSFASASIPSGSTIDGIEVIVEGAGSSTGWLSLDTGGGVTLPKGSRQTNSSLWTSADVNYSVGGASSLWGGSWAASDFNSSWDLTLQVYNKNTSSARTASIDYVSVTIYYTENTDPRFTTQPSVNHNSGYSHIGANNTPASVSFTSADDEQSSLSYTVKKSGSTVKSGTVSTGAQSVSIAYNDSNLADGSNSLTLTLDDGVGGTVTSSSFTLYRDTSAPTDPTSISHSPNPVTNTKEYTLSFTPADATSTGASQMRYEVWTGSGGSGTKLTGPTNCTSGTGVTTPTLSDSGLANGSNTRYIRTRDGAGNWSEKSVTVTALLKVAKEITVDPAGAGAAAVTLKAARRIVAGMDGAAVVAANLTAARLIAAGIDGSAAAEVGMSAATGISATIYAGGWVGARLLPAAFINADALAWGTANAVLRTTPLLTTEVNGAAGVDALLRSTAGFAVTATGASEASAWLAIVPELAVGIAGTATTTVEVSFRSDFTASIAGHAEVAAAFQEYVTPGGYRLRADLFDASDVPLSSGPLWTILGGDYAASLDEVGTFTLAVPAHDPAAVGAIDGARVRLYRDGEGLLFRGVIGARETVITPDGNHVLTISGDSLARELVHENTLLGRAYGNVPMSSVVSDLLSGSGWTAQSVAADARNVTAQYDGASIWQALAHSAELFGWHLRERNLSRAVDVGPFGASSGLVLRNVEHVRPVGDMSVLPIARIQITDRQDELWNRIIPVGGGEGVNRLTLQYSDRVAPYTIQQATGPGGEPYWHIEDATSVAAHGARTKVVTAKDIVPLSNSPAEIRDAANALYATGAAWLGWHSAVQESYQVDVLGLRHIVAGQVRVRVGDKVRLTYRGVVGDQHGRRVWRDIDRDVWLLGYKREFNEDGSDRWTLSVSSVDRATPSDAEVIAKALEDLWAIKTAARPFTYVETHGPYVESIAAGKSVRFPVALDGDVTWLHRATLRVRKRRVKSNVTSAAAGGGQTASSGGGQTTSSGGGVTSSSSGTHTHAVSSTTTPSGGGHTSDSGSAHTHSVTGKTTLPNGEHHHQIGQYGTTSAWATPGYRQQVMLAADQWSSMNYGLYVARNGVENGSGVFWTFNASNHTHGVDAFASESESTHRHGVLNHTHSVSGQTAAAGGDHTHTVPSHTHTVSNHTHTVSDHTHALIYGVYQGPNPTAPQMTIEINGADRTTALGGPWDSDFTVDITQYLVDGQGQPLRQTNTIEISAVELMDAEVSVRLMASTTSVVPVG
jgi:hypothetical protein